MNQSGPQMGGVGRRASLLWRSLRMEIGGGPQQPYSNTAPGMAALLMAVALRTAVYGAGAQMGGYNNNMGGQATAAVRWTQWSQMAERTSDGPAKWPAGSALLRNAGERPQGQPYYGQMLPVSPVNLETPFTVFLGIFKKDPTEVFDKAGNSKSRFGLFIWQSMLSWCIVFGMLCWQHPADFRRFWRHLGFGRTL